MATYPNSPIFKAVNFKSICYTLKSETISGRTQARSLGGHRFEFSAKYSQITRREFAPVSAFVMKQRGSVGIFQIVLPDISGTAIKSASVIKARASASIGATTVLKTGRCSVGDYIKFSHSKVYMVTAESSGQIDIEPPLNKAVSAQEVLYQIGN